MAIASFNPATDEQLKAFTPHDAKEIETRLERGENAFQRHRRRPFVERAQLLAAAASILDAERDKFARIITQEMGKILRASIDEVEKCARVCRFYAENGERFLEDEVAQTQAGRSFVRYEPLGIILAIMPWNFPFWQVFRFSAPA